MPEHRAEATEYMEAHRLNDLLANLTASLAFTQPGKLPALQADRPAAGRLLRSDKFGETSTP